MAQNATYTRRINLYINGKEVKNDVKSIRGEMQKAIIAQSKMTIGSKEYIAQGKKIQALNAILKQHKQQLYQTKSGWSGLGKVADGFNRYFGIITAGIASLTGLTFGLKKATDAADDFEEKLDNLSALTGLGGSDLQWLGDTAKETSVKITESGVRIKQSAGDILDAYTMIGSQRPELLKNKEALAKVTEQAIILSEAAKSKLEPAAGALTNTLNQFNLSGKESNRVINVLAAGSKEGAANIPYLSQAIEKMGTTYALMGGDVEQAVGIIEAIAPKFKKAEMAGNSLDKVLLKMKAEGIGYTDGVFDMGDALNELAKRMEKGESSADIFGVEHAKMADVLVQARSEVNRYTKAVTGTTIAEEQAAKNTRNRKATLAQAKNQINLLAIQLGEQLSPAVTKSYLGFGSMLKSVLALMNAFSGLSKIQTVNRLKEEQKAVNVLVGKLSDVNMKSNERLEILEELRTINPRIVEGLEAENLNYKQLKDNMKAYNEELVNKIILANLEAEEEEKAIEAAEVKQKELETQAKILDIMAKTNSDIAFSERTHEEKLKLITNQLKQQVDLEREEYKAITKNISARDLAPKKLTEEEKAYASLIQLTNYHNELIEEGNELQGDLGDFTKRKEVLKELMGLNAMVPNADEDEVAITISPVIDPKAKAELDKFNKEKEQAEKELAKTILQINRKLNLDKLSEQQREEAEINDRYADYYENLKQYGIDNVELEKLQHAELAAVQNKYDAKKKHAKKEVARWLNEQNLSDWEKEKQQEIKKYQEQLDKLEEHGVKTGELWQSIVDEIEAIRESEEPRDIFGMTEEDWEGLQENIDKVIGHIDQIGNAWGSINRIMDNQDQKELQQYERSTNKKKDLLNNQLDHGLISQEQYNAKTAKLDADLDKKKEEIAIKQAKRDKALRLFEAGVNTAAAIAAALPNIALSIIVGALGALQIAAIASEPLPAYATGGFTNGDRIYRAGEEGTEWIASNTMVNDPYTGPVIAALEAVRKGKAPASMFGGVTPAFAEMQDVPAFKNGGFSNQAAAPVINVPGTDNSELLARIDSMTQQIGLLTTYLSDPKNRKAYITNSDLDDKVREDEERNSIANVS